MPAPDLNTDIATLARLVTEAQERHSTARREAAAARNTETAALNNLNAAQSKLDAALTKLRKEASSESEWGRSRNGRPASNG